MDMFDAVRELVGEAIAAMTDLPRGFVPTESHVPSVNPMDAPSVTDMLRRDDVQTHVRNTLAGMPQSLLQAFISCGSALGQLLGGYGVHERVSTVDFMSAGLRDPEIWSLMTMALQVRKELQDEQSPPPSDEGKPGVIPRSAGMLDILYAEIQRRALLQRMPYASTLTTLLGPDAFKWLTAPSQSGMSKLQPHELSRVNWADLDSIGTQLRIEKELILLDRDNSQAAKSVVAIAWTLVALASFMDPALFLGDHGAHISSLRGHQLTWSSGIGTHTIVAYQPDAMLSMVRVLAFALAEPLVDACDLMWIAAGLARKRTVMSGTGGKALPPREQRFSLFVSHRGVDAKQQLLERLIGGRAEPTFLDCLVLPKGLVNRRFVFESLARSDRFLMVETTNYMTSPWCRKELWLAQTLAELDLITLERKPLAAALEMFGAGPSTSDAEDPSEYERVYPITDRILKDINYWAREPNRHSVEKSGLDASCLSAITDLLASEDVFADSDPAIVVAAVHAMFAEVVKHAPENAFDLWATAAQYAVAALGAFSLARSKMDVRDAIDRLNVALRRMTHPTLVATPEFQTHAARYLSLICAATVLDLCDHRPHQRSRQMIRAAVAGLAIFRDGLLLLDCRGDRVAIEPRLRVALLLCSSDLRGVGILQDAHAPVHELVLDDDPVSVLACVTLHPGMEQLFAS